MEVFISWSGQKSRKIGAVLNEWIPSFLQTVKPYYTPESIDKGKRWLTDILSKLNSSSIGIICLTSDNLEKPWILFEAGALGSKLEDSKVCPIVFGIPKSSVTGPLTIFQVTEFTEEDFKKLIKSINNDLGEHKVSDNIIDKNFEAFFPSVNNQIKTILDEPSEEAPKKVQRTQDELIEELVTNTRSLIKYSAETISLLQANRPKVNLNLQKYYTKRPIKKQDNTNSPDPLGGNSPISPVDEVSENEVMYKIANEGKQIDDEPTDT